METGPEAVGYLPYTGEHCQDRFSYCLYFECVSICVCTGDHLGLCTGNSMRMKMVNVFVFIMVHVSLYLL